jgi:hypothetical protein
MADLIERDYLKDLGVDGGNIKMGFQELGWNGVDWIDLSWDVNKWRAVVKAVTNIRFRKMQGISWLAEEKLPFEKDCTAVS